LGQKANVNAKARNGKSCLHFEALLYHHNKYNNDEWSPCIKWLIDAGAEIDAKDNNGHTALFLAFINGKLQIVNYLLEKSANPDNSDSEGNTCLHYASKSESFECVELLVNRVKRINCQNQKQETPLHLAAALQETSKRISIIAALLERGINPNIKDSTGQTALHFTAIVGSSKSMKLLIEKNADINAVNNDGKTSLHFAAEMGYLNCVELLVVGGAEINTKTNNGYTALLYAAMIGHNDIVKYLLGKSANPYITDNEGNECLHLASESQSLECLILLDNCGKLSVNRGNLNQQTPLHFACNTYSNSTETITFLLEQGASPNIKNANGQTSLHLAAGTGNFEFLKLLIENSAKINGPDEYDGILKLMPGTATIGPAFSMRHNRVK
jgi:ankyrin repeat protein